MFEKFTEGAIKVIMLSQEEARRWDITLLVQNNFIRCYWTTWNGAKKLKLH
jgi:hypothetical protein